MTPPRGMADCAIRQRLSSSLTLFLAANWRGGFHARVVRSPGMTPRVTVSASPVSIDAPNEPAAPKASRQNCSRAEAAAALFLIRSVATARISGSFSSSSTSRPLTIAPTGEITSWQTREHSSAARSIGARATIVIGIFLWLSPPTAARTRRSWAAGAIVFDSPSRRDWAMSGSEERKPA